MSTRSERFLYRLATPADSPGILEVMESGSFSGNISVLFTRRPDPVASLLQEGGSVVIPVMIDRDNDKICGVGCCAIRKAFVNGKKRQTGYLMGLKIHSDYQRRVPHFSQAYAFLHEQTRHQVDLYYTTILKDNVTAKKLLEKKRKGMPEYRPVDGYTVYCFRRGVRTTLPGTFFEKGNPEGVREFYEAELPKAHLAPVEMYLPGLKDSDFYTLRNSQGKIVAACALWNQQEAKQYIITGYGGLYRWAKHLPLHWLGYPGLPREGEPANYGSIALFCVENQDPETAACLLFQVAESAREYDFFMAGLMDHHPLKPLFQSLKHIKYQSTLYTVHWETPSLTLDHRPIQLEVGLL